MYLDRVAITCTCRALALSSIAICLAACATVARVTNLSSSRVPSRRRIRTHFPRWQAECGILMVFSPLRHPRASGDPP